MPGAKGLGVLHRGENPGYGIVFDRAVTVSAVYEPGDLDYVLDPNYLHFDHTTVEHMALILIAPRANIDAIYDEIPKLFATPEIQALLPTQTVECHEFDSSEYSVYQANLDNGMSILHVMYNSWLSTQWETMQRMLVERGVWNVDIVLEPDDLFNCYYSYFDEWMLDNTSIEFAQSFYDTFKKHPFFKDDPVSQLLRDEVVDKIEL